jgi:hypothetical protein
MPPLYAAQRHAIRGHDVIGFTERAPRDPSGVASLKERGRKQRQLMALSWSAAPQHSARILG